MRMCSTTLLLKRLVLSSHTSYSVSDQTAVDITTMTHVHALLSSKLQGPFCFQPNHAQTGKQVCKAAFNFKPFFSPAHSPSLSLNRSANDCTARNTRLSTRTVTCAAQISTGEVRHTCMRYRCSGFYSQTNVVHLPIGIHCPAARHD